MLMSSVAGIALAAALLAIGVCGAACESPQDGTISPGTVWYDTDGHRIQAHGGGMLVEDSTYYWFGTTDKLYLGLSEGINLYKSQDLQHWTFVSLVFRNTSIVSHTPGPYRIERPKVIFNEATQKYVMWFHLDTAPFTLRSVGVATSDTIDGEYTFVSGFMPDGLASYDMTLFKDDDGSAYLCRSVENQYAGISQLTADYLNTTGIISKGPRVEGQAIFKLDGAYYLLGSHLTGWAANPAVLSRSKKPTLHDTDWDILGNPSGSPTTFDSQSTYVLPYTHPDGRLLLIYQGDRWNDHGPGGLPNATYIWLPFQVHTVSSGSLGGATNSSLRTTAAAMAAELASASVADPTLSFSWHNTWKIADFP